MGQQFVIPDNSYVTVSNLPWNFNIERFNFLDGPYFPGLIYFQIAPSGDTTKQLILVWQSIIEFNNCKELLSATFPDIAFDYKAPNKIRGVKRKGLKEYIADLNLYFLITIIGTLKVAWDGYAYFFAPQVPTIVPASQTFDVVENSDLTLQFKVRSGAKGDTTIKFNNQGVQPSDGVVAILGLPPQPFYNVKPDYLVDYSVPIHIDRLRATQHENPEIYNATVEGQVISGRFINSSEEFTAKAKFNVWHATPVITGITLKLIDKAKKICYAEIKYKAGISYANGVKMKVLIDTPGVACINAYPCNGIFHIDPDVQLPQNRVQNFPYPVHVSTWQTFAVPGFQNQSVTIIIESINRIDNWKDLLRDHVKITFPDF